MRSASRFSLLLACLLAGACTTSRPLPKYEKPLARTRLQAVRTTAYTHTESDHRQYACNSAMGTPLQCGSINSAAADWSRWPAGTMFRLLDTGELFQVDDYGWALSGTNTIDLYKPTRSAMNSWGVHRSRIEVLQWGSAWRSYDILKPRAKYAHVKRMLKQIEQRYARESRSYAPVAVAPAPAPAPITVARAEPANATAAAEQRWPKAEPVRTAQMAQPAAAGQPFYR